METFGFVFVRAVKGLKKSFAQAYGKSFQFYVSLKLILTFFCFKITYGVYYFRGLNFQQKRILFLELY